jgi:hypothetical protein
MVLIGGEARIGKTAQAEVALAKSAGRRALALAGRCYDLSETPCIDASDEGVPGGRRAVGLPGGRREQCPLPDDRVCSTERGR